MGKSLEADRRFCEQPAGQLGQWVWGCNRRRGLKVVDVDCGQQSLGELIFAWEAVGSEHSFIHFTECTCPGPGLWDPVRLGRQGPALWFLQEVGNIKTKGSKGSLQGLTWGLKQESRSFPGWVVRDN